MEIEQSVIKRISALKDLPSLPHILVKLMAACNDENESLGKIAAILSKDPSLCSKVLKLANSAYYSLGRRIEGIDQAVAYLGTRTVKNIAICSAVYQTFNARGKDGAFNLKSFWRHSLKCALLARIFAGETGAGNPEEAFVAGLLHDIGKLVLWVNFADKRADSHPKDADQSHRIETAEIELGATHSQVGAWLLDRWKFQSFVVDAALYHQEPLERIIHALPLTKAVYLADKLAEVTAESYTQRMRAAGQLCGFSRDQVLAFLVRSDEEIGEVARSFGIEIETPAKPAADSVENDRAAYEDLNRRVRNLSLLMGTLRSLTTARDEEDILKYLHEGLQILFDLRQVCFFRYDTQKEMLIGKIKENDGNIAEHGGLVVPMRTENSLLVSCLTRGNILDSFSRGDAPALVLADEQMIRYLGTEGMLCLPLTARGEYVGVIAAGLDHAGFSDLGGRLELLEMFAGEAALALRVEQLRQQQLGILQAERAEAAFAMARKIVHEVNNPLGIMKNYLKILGNKLKSQGIAQDEIEILNEEINRVAHLVGGLTAVSGANSHQAEAVDLNALIKDLIKLTAESLSAEKNVAVHADLDPAIPNLLSDGDKLKQIFMNLMKNAAEAMVGGGNLLFKTRCPHAPCESVASRGLVEVTVCDDGPGISDAMKRRLFEPFVSSKGRGHSGLGLSIVLNLIKSLNGSIVCESELGKGTCFRIELPVVK